MEHFRATPRSSDRHSVEDTARELLGDEAPTVLGALACIETAEVEIEAAKKRHPDKADKLHATFLLLRADNMTALDPGIYRAHVRELLERVVLGADTRPGTNAEVLVAMMQVATATPVTALAIRITDHVARAVGPDAKLNLPSLKPSPEAFEGEVEQELGFVRKKLAQDWRVAR